MNRLIFVINSILILFLLCQKETLDFDSISEWIELNLETDSGNKTASKDDHQNHSNPKQNTETDGLKKRSDKKQDHHQGSTHHDQDPNQRKNEEDDQKHRDDKKQKDKKDHHQDDHHQEKTKDEKQNHHTHQEHDHQHKHQNEHKELSHYKLKEFFEECHRKKNWIMSLIRTMHNSFILKTIHQFIQGLDDLKQNVEDQYQLAKEERAKQQALRFGMETLQRLKRFVDDVEEKLSEYHRFPDDRFD
ncbi:hypothetical protein SSS_00549 [Sarcoptes scabiei]|uniref:Uncharacterized protein n=2 Tax=Sarcoptes scabiei TaxID=52283 RepID=A0A834RBL8_SARSC|nr:hypothetical protein SSS_00549 [Sarcoptes scabiei]